MSMAPLNRQNLNAPSCQGSLKGCSLVCLWCWCILFFFSPLLWGIQQMNGRWKTKGMILICVEFIIEFSKSSVNSLTTRWNGKAKVPIQPVHLLFCRQSHWATSCFNDHWQTSVESPTMGAGSARLYKWDPSFFMHRVTSTRQPISLR